MALNSRYSKLQCSFAGGLVRRVAAIARVTATGTRTYFVRTAELVSVALVESAEWETVLSVVRNLSVINCVRVAGLVTASWVAANLGCK